MTGGNIGQAPYVETLIKMAQKKDKNGNLAQFWLFCWLVLGYFLSVYQGVQTIDLSNIVPLTTVFSVFSSIDKSRLDYREKSYGLKM